MLTIASFKWKKNKKKLLPMDVNNSFSYTPMHVNILYSSIKRNIDIPFRFVCITDNSDGINPEIEIIQLWDKCLELGGCYNRLYIFSPEMKNILGERFACIDLDCVITGNVTDIFSRSEDFIINEYVPVLGMQGSRTQKYNGGFLMMNAGCRQQVWNDFDKDKSPKILAALRGKYSGSDQAWIRYVLGDKESVFSEKDGVYEARKFNDRIKPPKNSKIVFFAGRRDPSISTYSWVKECWRQ